MNRHVMIHKDDREVLIYHCEKCSFETRYADSLEQHKVVHNTPDELSMFHCFHCSFKTKYRLSVIRHLRKHRNKEHSFKMKNATCLRNHKNIYQTSEKALTAKCEEILNFECYHCSFKTLYKSNLIGHLRRHKKRKNRVIVKNVRLKRNT